MSNLLILPKGKLRPGEGKSLDQGHSNRARALGSEPSSQGSQSRVLSSIQTHVPHLIGLPPPDQPKGASGQGCRASSLGRSSGQAVSQLLQSEDKSAEAGVAKVKPARLLGQSLGAVRWQKRAQLGLVLGQRPRPDIALLGAGGGLLTLQGGSANGRVDSHRQPLIPTLETPPKPGGQVVSPFILHLIKHKPCCLLLPCPLTPSTLAPEGAL